MKILNRICFTFFGVDVYISNTWYGIHFYWQEYPLFDTICSHTKCNTVHKYGLIIFGLWIYFRIDE